MNTHLVKYVPQFAGTRILVIGDIIVDHFIWGTVSRISPEAPVPVVNVTREEMLLGGGANVLHNIYSLGGEAVLCGIIGNDEMGGRLQQLLTDLGASSQGLVQGKRPTTVKTRVVAQGQQVVRFDREQTGVPSEQTIAVMLDFIDKNLAGFDVVIVSDYYKGVISQPLMSHLLQKVHEVEQECGRRIPVVVDPKPDQPDRFKGATIITPNHLEAEKMSGQQITSDEDLAQAAEILRTKFSCEAVLITRGEAGMSLLERGQGIVTIPTMAREVFDVTGAGDTVIATLALGLAAGASFTEAATLANVAAGIVVGKIGTATVSSAEILAELQGELP
ncbi:MAG: D-glycero-beta-D-manno-heptose-7-phosphate kinase [Proteobacteria bacterium]|nr:D-glycero-beta-D-manno-heptose-7-phosphate kinase [Pseudomonadota bacterium]MBU1649577.1 D-glycero-beta-D-manno-heptose-7-phosphate kinase [Pseudomonadota bacterium]MBU1987047.1 D-glycero-beta-D-manno-heptose-7-phosphate kinase [Pseudomonadota bacterium]